MGMRENKFQSSENLWERGQNFTDPLHFMVLVLSSVSFEVQHLFSMIGVARNDVFLKRC